MNSRQTEDGRSPTGRATLASHQAPAGLGHSEGIPNVENLRVVSLQISKREGAKYTTSITQHWGFFDSDEEALGNALTKLPEMKPGFSLDQYLVCAPLAQRIEARSDETLQAARPEGQEPDGNADAP